jgi:hypothetical protein
VRLRTSALHTFRRDETLRAIIRRLLFYFEYVDDELVSCECFFRPGAWIQNFQPRVASALIRSFALGNAADDDGDAHFDEDTSTVTPPPLPPSIGAGIDSDDNSEKKGVVVYDPCGGWGGRLLGAHLSGLVKTYVCCEPAEATRKGLEAFAKDLANWGSTMKVTTYAAGAEVVSPEVIGGSSSVDLVLTSPPYFDLERYSSEPSQSHVKFPEFNGWVEGFLVPLYRTAFSCLKPGHFCLINVTSTPSDPILKNLEGENERAALQAGFVLDKVIDMRKPDTTTSSASDERGPPLQPPARVPVSAERAPEKIYVFRRPS